MRARVFPAVASVVVLVLGAAGAAARQDVTRQDVPGIRNFAEVETTVACAGATTPESMAAVRRLGFKSVINLRLSTEQGADIEAETAAAESAGLRYVHLPLDGARPDPAVVDQFLKTVSDPANQPAFIHCATGNRAAAMWMIKRVMLDRWDRARAEAEATSLGLTSAGMKTFVTSYLDSHPR
jgi:uncharacterized protein (TIGR01244 family)